MPSYIQSNKVPNQLVVDVEAARVGAIIDDSY